MRKRHVGIELSDPLILHAALPTLRTSSAAPTSACSLGNWERVGSMPRRLPHPTQTLCSDPPNDLGGTHTIAASQRRDCD
ncbi:unnamed protein product [Mycena citricolor]|uniref:Uncharacterized protein n=1 Tax=Mycena citricolor TaxID=2018698 RepID=A0AAD2JXB4_9AGAR|nr:unnamed protein product [Mycena citricolor]